VSAKTLEGEIQWHAFATLNGHDEFAQKGYGGV